MKNDLIIVPKQSAAEGLAEGYYWFDFPDGTGFLASPDGENKYLYDLGEGLWVKNAADDDEKMKYFQMPTEHGKPSLKDFKETAEAIERYEVLFAGTDCHTFEKYRR